MLGFSVKGPIGKLSKDVLESIFLLIATSGDPEMAMRFTSIVWISRTCPEWSDIIFKSQSIWGRLVFIDSNGNTNGDSPENIVKRSGKAPLWIEASRIDNDQSHLDRRRSLIDILEHHWERVEYLSILSIQDDVNERLLAVFKRPAPRLRFFHAEILKFNNGTNRLVAVEKETPIFPLFSDNAPLLKGLGFSFPFSLQSPWNPSLTSLLILKYSAFSDNMRTLLEALTLMPNLTQLDISHSIREEPQHRIESLPVVSLPSLTHLTLKASLVNCVVLIDKIEPSPSGCSINYTVQVNLDDYDKHLTSSLLYELIDKTLKYNLRKPSERGSPKFLSLVLNFDSLILAGHDHAKKLNAETFKHKLSTLSSMKSQDVYMNYNLLHSTYERSGFDDHAWYTRDTPYHHYPILYDTFNIPEFQNITTLRLHPLEPKSRNYTYLLHYFTSVVVLETTPANLVFISKNYLDMDDKTDIRRYTTDQDFPKYFFPRLDTLRIIIGQQPGHGRRINQEHHMLLDINNFIEDRLQYNLEENISTLELIGPVQGIIENHIKGFSEKKTLREIIWWDGKQKRVHNF